MRPFAFVFPGQGSQAVGMGKEIAQYASSAKAVFDQADTCMEMELSQLCFEGPEETLRQTRYTQPALLACSLALLTVLEERGLRPSVVAGHSIGEYSALAAAGCLSSDEAFRLVRLRAEAMAQAGAERPGSMAAVFGLVPAMVQAMCDEVQGAGHGSLEIANLNSPEQLVVSGDQSAIEAASAVAMRLGAKRYILLAVSAAFHSSLMHQAATTLSDAIARTPFLDAQIPVVTNVTASPLTNAKELRSALCVQLASRVRWVEMVECMVGQGIRTFVEVGPGKALSGLIKKIDRSLEVFQVADSHGVDQVCQALLVPSTV